MALPRRRALPCPIARGPRGASNSLAQTRSPCTSRRSHAAEPPAASLLELASWGIPPHQHLRGHVPGDRATRQSAVILPRGTRLRHRPCPSARRAQDEHVAFGRGGRGVSRGVRRWPNTRFPSDTKGSWISWPPARLETVSPARCAPALDLLPGQMLSCPSIVGRTYPTTPGCPSDDRDERALPAHG